MREALWNAGSCEREGGRAAYTRPRHIGSIQNVLKYILINRIDRQSANHDEQLEKTSLHLPLKKSNASNLIYKECFF